MPAQQRDLIDSVVLSPIAMVLANPHCPDNPIKIANSAFWELLGYVEAEILGRNCRFLAGDAPERVPTDEIRAAIRVPKATLVRSRRTS